MLKHKKKLEFLTQHYVEDWKKPVWKEWEVINADCPECKREVVVIQGSGRFVANLLSELPVLLLGELKGG